MKSTAILAAQKAGEFLMKNIGKVSYEKVDLKRKFDYVTELDKESENIIIQTLLKEFPDHKIYAEETTKDESGGYRWIIDPLDGTTNYIHTVPFFAVSIALEYNGEIILGVVYDPNREELFVAEKNKGATLNNHPIKASSISDTNISLLSTGFPFRSKNDIDLYQESFKKLFLKMSGIRRFGAVAIDFGYIACGRIDGFWEIGLAPWDVAAGYLIVKEAGGRMTDFAGGDEAIWTGNVVASNSLIHDDILRVVRHIFQAKIPK